MPVRGGRLELVPRRRLELREGFALLALATACSACSATGNYAYPKSFFTPAPIEAAAVDLALVAPALQAVIGHWEGVTSADCIGDTTFDPGRCHATQNITLTMLPRGDEITGYYTCAYGNEVCRNLDEAGVIRNGAMTGRRLLMRVMLEDGSMCFFTGVPANDVMEGRYSCLQGAGIVERGAFHAVRSY